MNEPTNEREEKEIIELQNQSICDVMLSFIGVPLGRMLQSCTSLFKYSQNARPHFFGLHSLLSQRRHKRSVVWVWEQMRESGSAKEMKIESERESNGTEYRIKWIDIVKMWQNRNRHRLERLVWFIEKVWSNENDTFCISENHHHHYYDQR